jgi:hypothetical protein
MLTNQMVGLLMANYQLQVAGIVIPFCPKPRAAAYLTSLDRLEINRWRDHAGQSGYDRMVIHEREPGDFAEMGNFLCLYRQGEAWSRWVFARNGGVVNAWCSVTGADLGEFSSLAAAFQAVMPGQPWMGQSRFDAASSGVVMDLLPRLRRALGT